MAEQIRNLIAKWNATWPSPLVVSRQHDNGQFRINLVDYPEPENYEDQNEEILETINYYLVVWMKQSEDGEMEKLAPIQLPGPYWLVSAPYTQLVQDIKFQFYATSSVTGYIAHSAQFKGMVLESLSGSQQQSIIPEEMWDAYKQYIEDKIIGAGLATIDPTLSIQGAAADAKATGDEFTKLNERLTPLEPAATSSDVGKVLKAKTVTNGKVTEYEFGEAGGDTVITGVTYDDADLVTYDSTATNTSFNVINVPITPNISGEYFVNSATVKTQHTGASVKFAVWGISYYYSETDVLNRKRFTKLYDIAVITSDENGLATIEFDVPLKIKTDETVLMASCQPGEKMAYGTYVDAVGTVMLWSTQGFWYDFIPRESPDVAIAYVSSGNCPWYELNYVLSEDCTVISESVTNTMQKQYTYSTYDGELDGKSANAVRNSALYSALNFVETENYEVGDTLSYYNGPSQSPAIYSYRALSLELPESVPIKLKNIDVFAKNGSSVKFGIYSFRRYSSNPMDGNYNRGYFTLEKLLGEVVAVGEHATLAPNDVDFDPRDRVLIVSSDITNTFGLQRNVSNGLMPFADGSTAIYDTTEGAECSTLFWYRSVAVTNQGLYTITYELAESKAVTTVTNVKDAVTDLTSELTGLKSEAVTEAPLRTAYNKYFCLLVDDVISDIFNVTDRLLASGIKPAFGLKMESIGAEITWDEVKKLQDMGFEIAFHGMAHTHTPNNTSPTKDNVMIADIAQYKTICAEHEIALHGYLGPNHYPLPTDAFKEFEWARTPYGLTGYGGPGRLATTFAAVAVYSCDPSGGAVPKSSMIDAANSVADNQYLTPMCHTNNLVTYIDDYMEVFDAWISAGFSCLRPMDAVKQSLFNSGGIGNNSTFEIQAGTATNPYYVIAGNGSVLHNP